MAPWRLTHRTPSKEKGVGKYVPLGPVHGHPVGERLIRDPWYVWRSLIILTEPGKNDKHNRAICYLERLAESRYYVVA